MRSHMHASRRQALLLVTAAATIAVPAAASAAPKLTPLKHCYQSVAGIASGETAILAGSGFTPGSRVDVAVDGKVVQADVPIGADGSLPAGSIKPPVARPHRSQAFTITATEQGNPAHTVSAVSRVGDLSVRLRPRSARPRHRIRFLGTGFTRSGRPVYAHYVRHGKLRRTIRLVRRARGACGHFESHRRQFPFRPAAGRWDVQIDQSRRYRTQQDVGYFTVRIGVARR